LGLRPPNTDFIRLEHPRGASAGAPDLTLSPDGTIWGIGNVSPLEDRDQSVIYANDETDNRRFQAFVDGLPAPTFFQALNSMTVWEMRMQIVLLLILSAFAAGLALFADWVWRFRVGLFR